jgi:UDP-3-O-[3-hydroxymyristoyl] glucosamine N-acyltransferase
MKVSQIADLLEGALAGDPAYEITGVAAADAAGPAELAYVAGPRALESAASSRAGCLLVPQEVSIPGRVTIAVKHPKLALVLAAAALHPEAPMPAGIHPTAVVAPDANLDASCSIGPNVVIESGVKVGPGTRLGAGVFIGQGARVGGNCVLHPRVTVYAGAQIGNRVIIHAGAVIGSDGFGYVFAEGRHIKFPQLGKILIEDDVEIGSNTTLDRGSLGTTVIGQGTKIDNLVQIAHNVKIGRHCVIASQVGISGSSEVGDYVVMAGQVGVGDHAYIEDRVVVGGQAGVLPGKIVRSGSIVWGTPCRPMSEFKKTVARLARLDALSAKVKALAQQVEKLAQQEQPETKTGS